MNFMRFAAVLLLCTTSSVVLAEDDEKWDVNDPPGERFEAVVDTDEGTWMSVSVSPDGGTIVFDLLGDIWSMPISGGEATALTSGLSWDEQPAFSPTGEWIAFTSDAGGGDNLWVMRADGSEARQVSEESFRLLNSPVWTPDGEFVGGRKHFTSARSAGAGEIWIYDAEHGGGGLQLTERPNDQKDLGEPAFSPDGKYLYYSQDTTPGDSFEYNKDSNTQIYQIMRKNLETGETSALVSGPGGAIRPTPSPDGKLLAFVRRVRFESVLFVKDLTSGEERPVYRPLSRDLQEAWAIHGVYPRMDWTPDSESVVLWANGKIHRVDVDSGEASEVPFHARQTHEMYPAQRVAHEVAPDDVDVKLTRWASVSPAGDQVVFQALGHLYVMALPDGEPRRLTRQDDHYEFYPSWSPSGRNIVYVTWDDQDLGAIRSVSSRGGRGKVLTETPGHFSDPRYSPDGEKIVFSWLNGGFLRSPNWAIQPGIYTMDSDGGEVAFVTSTGFEPFFSSDGKRIYSLHYRGNDDRRLVSVNLNGNDAREHFKTSFTGEFRLSPDERWLAFVERFHAYVVPFHPTGASIDVGPKMSSLPVKKVSTDAAEFLQWASDGSALYWSHGPTLFKQDIAAVYAKPEPAISDSGGDSEGDDEQADIEAVEPQTFNLGFSVPADKPSGSVAVVGGTVVTMDGDRVIIDGVVLTDGNRITAVGKRGQVEIPDDAFVLDAEGKTVIPGIVDAHWHGAMGQNQITPEQNWMHYATLALGVTTVHDPSNDNGQVFSASEMQRAGMITGPRIFSTGRILYGATTGFTAEVDSLDDARRHMRRMKELGAFSVKSYNQPRREQRQQVLQAARELDMLVVPEGGSLFQHNMNMVLDGHTDIEHNLPLDKVYDDVYQLWSQSEVGYTPTLVVAYGGLSGEYYWYAKTNVWEHPILSKYVPRTILDPRSRRRETAPDGEWNHIESAATAAKLQDHGVIVTVGAHGQREGLGAHWEMWMFEQGGMTPFEALKAGTIDGARNLGLDNDIGSLTVGKLADLAVIDGDVLSKLRDSDKVTHVMVNGRLYETSSMNEVGLRESERQRFWFEDCPGQAGPDLACN